MNLCSQPQSRGGSPQAKFFRDKRIVGDSSRMATSWKLLILNLAAAPKPEEGNKNRGIRRNKAADRNPVNELLTDFNCRAARAKPFDQQSVPCIL